MECITKRREPNAKPFGGILPTGKSKSNPEFSFDDLQKEGWARNIEEQYGKANWAALFTQGANAILDFINSDLGELRTKPRGTHMMQLPCPMLEGCLPEQFVPRYDYEFLYKARASLLELMRRAEECGEDFAPRSVMEEIWLYTINKEGLSMFDVGVYKPKPHTDFDGNPLKGEDLWEELENWPINVIGNDDVEFFLFTEEGSVELGHRYHFDNWFLPLTLPDKADTATSKDLIEQTPSSAKGKRTMPLSELVKTIREKRHLSQRELANLLNTSDMTISRLERGFTKNIRDDFAFCLAKFLTSAEYEELDPTADKSSAKVKRRWEPHS